jgi:hypothetical protein
MSDIAPNSPRPAVVGMGSGSSFVEWGAVIAGGAMAAALSFVLLTFGSAIGLSFVSPWANTGASTRLIASLAVFWVMAQQIGSAMVGGYIAGRMRSRWGETTEHEVEFRDGLHGGLVWAVGIIISAALLLSAAGAVARTGAEAAGQVASAASRNSDLLAYQADVLLRTAGVRPAGATPTATPTPASPQPSTQDVGLRAEVLRIMAKSVAVGTLSAPDRSYLAALVAQRTGLSQAEADKRVNDAYAEASRATKEAADKARHAAILTGFVTAAGLIVALGAAWWAAQRGGHHRDNSVPARLFTPPPRCPASAENHPAAAPWRRSNPSTLQGGLHVSRHHPLDGRRADRRHHPSAPGWLPALEA